LNWFLFPILFFFCFFGDFKREAGFEICGWGLRIIGNLNLNHNQIFLKVFKSRFYFFLLEGGESFELEKILVESAKIINTE
jgi:hypothetical protein